MTCNDQHPVPGTGSSHDLSAHSTRSQQTHKLFANCYGELLSIASDDSRLVCPTDPCSILDSVASGLHRYDGPPTEEGFIDWATPVTIRYRYFHAFTRENESAVRAGLWRVLAGCSDLFDDAATTDATPKQASRNLTIEYLMAEVWLWVWQNLDSLMTPGKARLSTRLNQRAFWVARAWKTQRLRERDRHADCDEADLLPAGFYISPIRKRKRLKKVS